MILEANLRDVKVKCRKFRNAGLATGLLNRSNGENVAISVKINEIDKFLNSCGKNPQLQIMLNGETLNTLVVGVERHLTKHHTINIDLKEI